MEPSRSNGRAAPAADHSSLFKSLGEVASLINASSDLDATLRHLLEAVCREAPWDAGGIMSVDPEAGYAQVIARHDPGPRAALLSDRWLLAESPSRLALARNQPVIIRDAQKSRQFPGYRREALEVGYRTVVVLPMEHRGPLGHRTVLSVRSREVVPVSPAEIALLRFVVHLGDIAMNKARSLAEEQAFGARLRSALAAHQSLLDQVLASGSVELAASKAGSMLPNPLVIVDLTSWRVLSEHSPTPAVIDDADWRGALAGEDARQFLDLARRRFPGGRPVALELDVSVAGRRVRAPATICPLTVDGERVGALIVFSRSADFHDLDHLLLESARFGLSVQMMRSYVAHAAEARSLEDLFADLLDGNARVADGIQEHARRLGVDLGAPARIVVCSLSEGEKPSGAQALELRAAATRIARRFDERAAVVLRSGAVLVRHSIDPRKSSDPRALMQRLAEEIRTLAGRMPIVVQSKICRRPEDYAPAWQECSRIRDLARRFGRSGITAAEDFGPFPVLMSAVDEPEMLAFVERLIGAVARHDSAHGTPYLQTLSRFLDHGCRLQPCADALDLHVTTLRYRLLRLKDLFGVQLDTPEQRFALQLALQFRKVIDPVDGPARR